MAIKGSDLKNKLPEGGKKNCKECGLPTCFAFAMKVTKGEIAIDKCPYVSSEVKAEIKEALTPPMALVVIGSGESAIELGQEEVMYRHEKSFLRQPALAILVSDLESDDQIDQKIEQMKNLVFVRAQETIKPDLWALKYGSGDRGRFEALARKIHHASPLSAIIISEDLEVLFWARDLYAERKPLIYPITAANLDQALPRIKAKVTPVGLKAEKVEDLIPLTERMKAEGLDQLILDPSSPNLIQAVEDQTVIRRCALKENLRALGYPTLAFPCALTNDPVEEILLAGAFVAKYAGVIVISTAARDFVYPLLIQRMDIYTDPRKLRSVEAKVYEINTPGEDAPVLVTTNFALTYFNVSSEVESSRIPAYLAILDTGGFGVQTSMGAGRFDGPIIAAFLKKTGLDQKIKTKRIILPHIAQRLRFELVDELPDWEIIVGPKAINLLSPFLVEKGKEWGLRARG